MITLTQSQWTEIRKKLRAEFKWKPSLLLIRKTMRRELGFTPRYQKDWITDADGGSEYRDMIHLDFYDEEKETWFRLKYL